MNAFSIKFKLLLLLFVVQLAIPVWMIARGEQTLHSGKVFRFESQPVDPFDAFRGRYVTLNLSADDVLLTVQDGSPPDKNESVYVTVETGADGYARLLQAFVTAPTQGDYLKIKVKSVSDKQIRVALPFDKYYLEEKLAAAAEEAYRKHSSANAKTKAYVTVKIKQGEGVLEELFIGDLPIRKFLAKEGIQ